MNNHIKNLCVIDSVYSLFLFIIINRGDINNVMFIVSEGIPDNIVKKLPYHFRFPAFRKSPFPSLSRFMYCFYFLIFKKSRLFKRHHKLSIYAQDHLFYSFIFLTKEYILLEDGLGNYVIHRKTFSSSLREFFLRGKEWGGNKKAKKVYLTGMADIPKAIINKTELINTQELWSGLPSEKKKDVMNLFEIDYFLANVSIGTIILTQPFSEENVISENDKIMLYKNIMENYKGDIYIKPHPRESTDYSSFLPDTVTVLPKVFPFQLLMMINPPQKIVTCFSTVAYTTKNISVDRYGTGFNKKLSERYGLIESVIDDN